MFLALAAIGLASCTGGFKKGPGGLLYNIHVDKSGPKIKEGDFISVQLIAKTDGDSVLFSTYKEGRSILTPMPKPQAKGDIYAGIQLLTEGDSATFKTAIDSILRKGQPRPPFKGKYIVYEVKIDKVIPKNGPKDTTFNTRVMQYMKGQADVMKNAEAGKFKKYIDDHKLTGTTTPSGLFYVITKQGTGDKPNVGDTVEVNYTAKLTSDKVFETSVRAVAQKNNMLNPMAPYKPIKIPVGVKAVIPGWDEGLLLLNKGAQATFVIPSKLAYGEQGYQIIQPYTPLVFEVELVSIKHADPNAKKPAPPVGIPPVQVQKPAEKK